MAAEISRWKAWWESGYLHGSKVFPHMVVINYKGENNNVAVEKPVRHSFNQAIKVTITGT